LLFRACLRSPTASGNGYGTWIEVSPLGGERISRRDLKIVGVSAFAFDSPPTSTFTGRVRRDSTGTPLDGADVIITDLGLSASTDPKGNFKIAGVSPGIHTVQVRKIGFAFSEERIEFGSEAVDRMLVMSRITILDSLSVKERPYKDPGMEEFEERRKLGRGHFVTRQEIALREGSLTSSFLLAMPQLKINFANGMDLPMGVAPKRCSERVPTLQELINARRPSRSICEVFYVPSADEAQQGIPVACYSKVYVDNALMNPGTPTPPFNLREIVPSQVEAIEFYARPSELPMKLTNLNSACGVVVIRTRRAKSP